MINLYPRKRDPHSPYNEGIEAYKTNIFINGLL